MAANEKYLTYSEASTLLLSNGNKSLSFYNASGGLLAYYLPVSGATINIVNVDGTSAINTAYMLQKGNAGTGIYNDAYITLKNYIVNKKTTGNAWYPMAIAGKQYANMTNGECLPTYYCSGVTINPYQGKIKVNDLILISGNTEISIADLIIGGQPTLVTVNTDDFTASFASQGNSFYMYGFTITISSSEDSVSWVFEDSWFGQEGEKTASPSQSTFTYEDGLDVRIEISGTIEDSQLGTKDVGAMEVYLWGFDPNGFLSLSYGSGADVQWDGNNVPSSSSGGVDFNMS